MSEAAAIETAGLSKHFRNCDAVHGLDLTVPEGSVFAFLGPNGAGKSTTIKMILNLIHPSQGEARVFDVRSQRLSREAFESIGYVSTDQRLPRWMTVRGLLDYLRPLYPDWDQDFCNRLLSEFDLPLDRKIRHLSRGMCAKTALVGALSFHPRLLVLDEPFSGLDALVRDEFMKGIIELTQQEQWTVFISSHDIDEVERLADRVGIIDQGRLRLSETAESLQSRFCRVSFSTGPDEVSLEGLPESWVNPAQSGRRIEFVDTAYDPATAPARIAERFGKPDYLSVEHMSLRDIFLVLARTYRLDHHRNGNAGGAA